MLILPCNVAVVSAYAEAAAAARKARKGEHIDKEVQCAVLCCAVLCCAVLCCAAMHAFMKHLHPPSTVYQASCCCLSL